MAVRIFTVEPADLPRYVELHGAIFAEPPSPLERVGTAEQLASYMRVHPNQQRVIAELDGRPAGLARAAVNPQARARGGVYAFVGVDAEFTGRGIGTSLYRAVSGWAAGVGASALISQLIETEERGLSWAARRGFVELARDQRLALELKLAPVPIPKPPAGIEVTTLAERPELLRGVYDVLLEAEPDVPGSEEIELPPFEEWRESEFYWATKNPEAVFIATSPTEVVGLASLDLRAEGLAVHVGTGVKRAWRGRGLARALKATQIAWAKEAGYDLLETSNDLRNTPILRLNESFGYTERPSVLTLRGPLAPT